MRKRIGQLLLIAFLMLGSFIAGRTSTTPAMPDLPEDFSPLAAMLEGKRLDWDLDKVPFETLVEQLKTRYDVPLAVNWQLLEAAGIGKDTPVTLHARQVELHQAIRMLASDAPYALNQVTFVTNGNLVVLTTIDDVSVFRAETRIYDIRSLYRRMTGEEFAMPGFTTAPVFGTYDSTTTLPTGGGLFGEPEPVDSPTREEQIEQITSVIRESIDPGSWKEDGGSVGSLYEVGGLLIVRCSPYAHWQLRRLLNGMAAHPNEAPIWRAPATQPVGAP